MCTAEFSPGSPFTATELRLQLSTLESMVADAYREWADLCAAHDKQGLITFESSPEVLRALAERHELMARYELRRAWYRDGLTAYYAASNDNSYAIREGW